MSTNDPAPETAQRTCIVCREVRSGDQLLQLGVDDGLVRVGRPRRPGKGSGQSARSAYVCIARACLERVGSKNLSRSLKRSVRDIDAAQVLEMVRVTAARSVLETIGLARRTGILDVGLDAATDREMPLATTIVAGDAPEATRARAARFSASTLADGKGLGHAAGMDRIDVLRIRAGRLAHRAAYWLQVLERLTGDEQGRTATTNGSREVA